jgi:hypothetical protein
VADKKKKEYQGEVGWNQELVLSKEGDEKHEFIPATAGYLIEFFKNGEVNRLVFSDMWPDDEYKDGNHCRE